MKIILSFLALFIIHCVRHEARAQEKNLYEHFLVSDRDNNKFSIIGPNFKKELELDFDDKDKFIKAIKAQYKDGVLTFFWIYFDNDGEVNIGKVPNENPELEVDSVDITKSEASSLTDIDVLDDLLFASTSTGEIYSMDVDTQELDMVLADNTTIMALKTDNMHRNVYFTQCSGKSVLVTRSISKRREYNTPLCFHNFDIDYDANTLYAAALNKIYSWNTNGKENFKEIHSTGSIGEIRNIVNGDDYLYFKTEGDRCFKLNKKSQSVDEIPELCAISHFGPVAFFKAPVFVPPTTTTQTTTQTTTTEATTITTQKTTAHKTPFTTVTHVGKIATELTLGSTDVTLTSEKTVQTTKSTTQDHEGNWLERYFWWFICFLILFLLLLLIIIVIVIVCVCRKKKKKNYEQM